MKNKITNKFKPRECIFLLGKTYYISQPKHTQVKYYVQDEDGKYVAILRRHTNVLPILAILSLLILIINNLMYKHNDINVKYNSTMVIQDNMLSLDLLNVSDSSIEYNVYLENNKIANGVINSNSSKSNVPCITELTNGNYHGVLEIKCGKAIDKKDILIVVKRSL